MKLKFLISSILLLLTALDLSAQTIKEKRYKLIIQKFAKENVMGTNYWLIECTLTNYSKDTLKYLSWSCSWTDFYTVDKKELEIEGFLCDQNIPTILALAPGKNSKEIIRVLRRKKFKGIKPVHFKVGLNVIKTTSTDNFDKKLKIKNILWSDEISLW